MITIILLIGFVSCTPLTIPETGTVTITVNESTTLKNKPPSTSEYYIYMDDVFQDMMFNLVPLTLENIPIGIHTFKASNFALSIESSMLDKKPDIEKKEKMESFTLFCSGMIFQEISSGVNYVEIPVNCTFIVPY